MNWPTLARQNRTVKVTVSKDFSEPWGWERHEVLLCPGVSVATLEANPRGDLIEIATVLPEAAIFWQLGLNFSFNTLNATCSSSL